MRISEEQLYHKESKDCLLNGFREGQWTTLYKRRTSHPTDDSNVEYDVWMWCYAITPELTTKVLNNYEPDLNWDERSALYADNRFKSYIKDGMESIVTVMRFDDVSPRKFQIRIHEDFIHMFHLYEEILENEDKNYVSFDAGRKEVIITIKQDEVRILHQYLNDFIASKGMNLVCVIRSELNMPVSSKDSIECDYQYTGHTGITSWPDPFVISNFSIAITGGIQFQSWYKGKKVFPYKEFGDFKSSFDSEYAEFIIGYDPKTCSEIKVKCDEHDMDYERSFFKRSVLEKYRSEANVKVTAYYIDSSPFYGLKCNNDHPEFIWAFLKNLRCLPYNEQLHWANYNILPPINLSEEYKYDHFADWSCIATLPEYKFKDLFIRINKKWYDAFGWLLFKELTGSHINAFDHLYSLGEDKEESFKILVKTLNLVLSESINVRQINKLSYKFKKESGGIGRLTVILEANGHIKNKFINYLLKLNTIRSEYTDTHRNREEMTSKLSESLSFFGVDLNKRNFREGSINLFTKGIEAFQFLDEIISNLLLEGNPTS